MTIISFVIGFLWHSKLLFGKAWKQENNPDNIPIKINAPLIFGGTALFHFIALSGLSAIVSIKIGEPQFEGQTKTKLGNTEAKSFTQKAMNDHLTSWFEKNPSEGKDIVRKSIDAAAARVAARKARDLSRNRKGLLDAKSIVRCFT